MLIKNVFLRAFWILLLLMFFIVTALPAKNNSLFYGGVDKLIKEGQTAKVYKRIKDYYKIPDGFKKDLKQKADYLEKDVYIFISSSIPIDTIRNYIKSIQNIKYRTVFILNGFIDGIMKFKPTYKYTFKLLCNSTDYQNITPDDCLEAIIDINPNIFEQFNIKYVPAILVLENGNINSCSVNTRNVDYYLSYGDAPFQYHLSKMESKGSKKAKEILSKLKVSYYDYTDDYKKSEQ